MNTTLHILLASFVNDHDVNVFSYKSEPHFLCSQIAAACGSLNPDRLVKLIAADDEYVQGTHLVTFTGEELAYLKRHFANSVQSDVPSGIASRAPSATAFTLAGLNLFLAKTELPKGRGLRAWLAEEVMPSILKTGSYGQPQIAGPAEPTPKAVPTPPAEFRRIGDRLWRSGRRAEATECYLAAAQSGLGRALTPSEPAPTPVAQLRLPLAKVDPWTALINAWEAEGGEPAKTTALLRIADAHRLFVDELKGHHGHGRASAFGRLLWRQRSRVIGGRLLTVSKLDGCTVWRLAEMAA